MTYEMMVGLNISSDENYNKYRAEMRPLLETYGGGFRYDFKVAETLKSESLDPINRVFNIYFRDKKAMDDFFQDPAYQKIKAKYFDQSVSHRTIIASFERA